MLRTRMFSEMPGSPGRRQQMPRIDDVDRHAGLAGPIQGFDHAIIDQRVDLGENPRRPAFAGPLGLLVDQFQRAALQVVGGHDQLPPLMALRIAGQQVEQSRGVGGDVFVGREQAQVGVEQRGGRVVVAGAQVDVAPQRVCLPAARPATPCNASSDRGSRTRRARRTVPFAAPN